MTKGPGIYIGITLLSETLKPEQQRFTMRKKVAYWPALAVVSAAQLAAAHCLNERNYGQR